jgi:hypothetical protein
MPKKIDISELNELRTLISNRLEGASVGELMKLDSISNSRRTLQRRIEELLEKEEITSKGEGRGRRYYGNMQILDNSVPRYFKPQLGNDTLELNEDPAGFETNRSDQIDLSPESQELKKLIHRPLAMREPIGYQAEFLISYIPNQTYYLSAEIRKEMAELGRLGTNELPAGTYLRHILSRLLIDLSWNSSRLEGNTYSLLETQKLLEHGVTADGKNTKEAQMILNHKAAIEMLADQTQEIGFNQYTVCNLHAMLADNLISSQDACGRIRDCAVGISGSVYMPLEIPQVIDEHFREIITKAAMIEDPIEASFFVMVHLPYLQAFEDVNKRTSRLAANIPMVMQNLCPLSFTDVDREDYLCANLAVYELNRIEYLRDLFVWAYRRSCRRYSGLRNQLGEPDPFKFKYRNQMKDTVRDIVRDSLNAVATEKYIHERAHELIPENEHKLFHLLVASELKSLHMGNIMRYRIRPNEFTHWNEMQ